MELYRPDITDNINDGLIKVYSVMTQFDYSNLYTLWYTQMDYLIESTYEREKEIYLTNLNLPTDFIDVETFYPESLPIFTLSHEYSRVWESKDEDPWADIMLYQCLKLNCMPNVISDVKTNRHYFLKDEFSLDQGPGRVDHTGDSVISIKIIVPSIDADTIESYLDLQFQLQIGRTSYCNITIRTLLWLAQEISNDKIKYYDDYCVIPLYICELFSFQKIDLIALQYHSVNISLNTTLGYKFRIYYMLADIKLREQLALGEGCQYGINFAIIPSLYTITQSNSKSIANLYLLCAMVWDDVREGYSINGMRFAHMERIQCGKKRGFILPLIPMVRTAIIHHRIHQIIAVHEIRSYIPYAI
jgi:hypothetical protein